MMQSANSPVGTWKLLSFQFEVEGSADESVGATPLREDVARTGVAREAVERNAPSFRDGHFVVPKVIE